MVGDAGQQRPGEFQSIQIAFQNPGRQRNISAGQSTESRSAVSNTSGTLPLFPQADRPIRMVTPSRSKISAGAGTAYTLPKRRLRTRKDFGLVIREQSNTFTPATCEVGHAGLHHFEVHLDEVVFNAAGFGGGEDLCSNRECLVRRARSLWSLRIPALHVHGNEPARIFREVLGGVISLG